MARAAAPGIRVPRAHGVVRRAAAEARRAVEALPRAAMAALQVDAVAPPPPVGAVAEAAPVGAAVGAGPAGRAPAVAHVDPVAADGAVAADKAVAPAAILAATPEAIPEERSQQ